VLYECRAPYGSDHSHNWTVAILRGGAAGYPDSVIKRPQEGSRRCPRSRPRWYSFWRCSRPRPATRRSPAPGAAVRDAAGERAAHGGRGAARSKAWRRTRTSGPPTGCSVGPGTRTRVVGRGGRNVFTGQPCGREGNLFSLHQIAHHSLIRWHLVTPPHTAPVVEPRCAEIRRKPDWIRCGQCIRLRGRRILPYAMREMLDSSAITVPRLLPRYRCRLTTRLNRLLAVASSS